MVHNGDMPSLRKSSRGSRRGTTIHAAVGQDHFIAPNHSPETMGELSAGNVGSRTGEAIMFSFFLVPGNTTKFRQGPEVPKVRTDACSLFRPELVQVLFAGKSPPIRDLKDTGC